MASDEPDDVPALDERAAPGRLATADTYPCMSAELDGEDDMRATAGFTSATRGRTH